VFVDEALGDPGEAGRKRQASLQGSFEIVFAYRRQEVGRLDRRLKQDAEIVVYDGEFGMIESSPDKKIAEIKLADLGRIFFKIFVDDFARFEVYGL
jgi:hypothetical protein